MMSLTEIVTEIEKVARSTMGDQADGDKGFRVCWYIPEFKLPPISGAEVVKAESESQAAERVRKKVWFNIVYGRYKRCVTITNVHEVPAEISKESGLSAGICPACGESGVVRTDETRGLRCLLCGEEYDTVDIWIKRMFAHKAAKRLTSDKDGGKKK